MGRFEKKRRSALESRNSEQRRIVGALIDRLRAAGIRDPRRLGESFRMGMRCGPLFIYRQVITAEQEAVFRRMQDKFSK